MLKDVLLRLKRACFIHLNGGRWQSKPQKQETACATNCHIGTNREKDLNQMLLWICKFETLPYRWKRCVNFITDGFSKNTNWECWTVDAMFCISKKKLCWEYNANLKICNHSIMAKFVCVNKTFKIWICVQYSQEAWIDMLDQISESLLWLSSNLLRVKKQNTL